MQLSLSFCLAVALTVVFASSGQLAAKPPGKAPPKSDLTAVSTEDLIASFQEVPGEYLNTKMHLETPGSIRKNGFLRFGPGSLNGLAFDIMLELVRRGPDAVPILLDHLSDARLTKIRLGSDSDPVECHFATWYDPRNPDLASPPPGVTYPWTRADEFETTKNYQIVIGDLCFVVLGQIVNRSLLASYDATGEHFVFVNSPVHSPAIAAAARADWSGLTRDGLKQCLIDDVQRANNDIDALLYGLQRLLFYYPDDGKELVVPLLARPVCNATPKYPIEPKNLYDVEDEKEQDHLLEEFRRKNGDKDYQLVVQGLILTANQTPENPSEAYDEDSRRFVQQGMNAKAIVARRFADMNRHPRTVDLNTWCDFQRCILIEVAHLPSREIDQTARNLLDRTLELHP